MDAPASSSMLILLIELIFKIVFCVCVFNLKTSSYLGVAQAGSGLESTPSSVI